MTTVTKTADSGRSTNTSESNLEFGYRYKPVQRSWFSARIPIRLMVVSALLFLAALLAAAAAMTFGEGLTWSEMGDVLAGEGSRMDRKVFFEWRMPIAIASVVFGALLALGGAIFQSLTSNPLGSPDIIGFDSGSYTAVVFTLLVFNTTDYNTIAAASIIGGLITAFAVYVLAWRRGVQGFRLIIVGIGLSAMLGSVTSYIITRAEYDAALQLGFWGAGRVGRVTWDSMVPALLISAVLFIVIALLSRSRRQLEMGDDTAITHGTRPTHVRLALIVAGVATGALVTAAAGPIGFVALIAPQLAHRLVRTPGLSLLASACMGACLLAITHLITKICQEYYKEVPEGVIMVAIGGGYLIWLLIREARKHYGTPT